MKRCGIAVVVVLGLVALPGAASARTQVVYAAGQPAFANQLSKHFGEALAFFPGSVTIHAGDSIAWVGLSDGFHTIDLPGKGGPLPLITPTSKITTGVNDGAGNPFWFTGKVPIVSFNPAVGPPSGGHSYTGSSRVVSGLPTGPPKTFTVKFPKTGRYAYFCDVHPGMQGKVVVLAKGKAVPSAAQNAATVAKQQAASAAVAKKLLKTKIKGDVVSLGIKGAHNVEILQMFQGVTHVKAGTTITFQMPVGSFETHTATFGPPAYLSPLAKSFTSPIFDSRAVYPSSPPGTGPITLASSAHGNGFANTGALQRVKGSPLPPLNKITFTTKGTYRFECLVHEFMHGVVIVQ
jgi:plastocyanin